VHAAAVLAIAVMAACATAPRVAPASSEQQPAPAAPASQAPAGTTGTAAGARRAPLPADSMEIARRYTRWLYSAEADSLVAHHSAEGRARPRMKEELVASAAELAARAGTEVSVVEEKFVTRNGRRQYWRTANFSSIGEPMLVRWVINSAGEIEGMGMGPRSQAPPIDPEP
jgi:hypothetical protein